MQIDLSSLAKQFSDEDAAYQLVERLRWPTGPVCPHCGDTGRAYFLKARNGYRTTTTGKTSYRRLWKCAACRKQFSVITGTIMHGTKVSLEIWVFILFEMCANKNGLAAREVERKYGLTAKTAWFVTQRIREAMKREPLAGLLANTTVEVDETFFGGKPKNRHQQGRPSRLPSGAGSYKSREVDVHSKIPVLSLVDRQTGEVYSEVVTDVTGSTIRKALTSVVNAPEVHLITDGGRHYRPLGTEYQSHQWVDHSSYEYVRGEVTTNRVEGYFSQLKRSVDGTHHHVSRKHLPRYLAEFDFRYSTRKLDDTQRTLRLVGRIGDKRLTYRPLRDGR